MNTRSLLIAAAGVAVAVALVGCGGSGGRIDLSGSGTITSSDRRNRDGSYGDLFRFVASRTGLVEVRMSRISSSSSVEDPYIVVWSGAANDYTSETFIAFDDDSGPGLDAYLVFSARPGWTYTVLFTTAEANDFGTYRYSIREVDYTGAAAQADNEPAKPAVQPAQKRSS